jgi:hypothetical protein
MVMQGEKQVLDRSLILEGEDTLLAWIPVESLAGTLRIALLQGDTLRVATYRAGDPLTGPVVSPRHMVRLLPAPGTRGEGAVWLIPREQMDPLLDPLVVDTTPLIRWAPESLQGEIQVAVPGSTRVNLHLYTLGRDGSIIPLPTLRSMQTSGQETFTLFRAAVPPVGRVGLLDSTHTLPGRLSVRVVQASPEGLVLDVWPQLLVTGTFHDSLPVSLQWYTPPQESGDPWVPVAHTKQTWNLANGEVSRITVQMPAGMDSMGLRLEVDVPGWNRPARYLAVQAGPSSPGIHVLSTLPLLLSPQHPGSLRVWVPQPGILRWVRLSPQGNTVQVLAEQSVPAGSTVVVWDGRDTRGIYLQGHPSTRLLFNADAGGSAALEIPVILMPARISVQIDQPESGEHVQGTLTLLARTSGELHPMLQWYLATDSGRVWLGNQLDQAVPLLWMPPETLAGAFTLIAEARWQGLHGADSVWVIFPGDTLPPVLQLRVTGPVLKRDSFWIVRESSRVHLQAQDTVSGVETIQYRWIMEKSSPGGFLPYTQPVPIPEGAGILTLEVHVTDRSGNSATSRFSFLRDVSAPVGAWMGGVRLGPGEGPWVVSAGDTLRRTYGDSLSGVEHLSVDPILPGIIQEDSMLSWPVIEGPGTLRVTVMDSLGWTLNETLRWEGDADPPILKWTWHRALPDSPLTLYQGDQVDIVAQDTPAGVMRLTLTVETVRFEAQDTLRIPAEALPEGRVSLQVQATDSLQHTLDTLVTVQVVYQPPDTFPPVLQLTLPEHYVVRDPGMVLGRSGFSGRVLDASGLASVRYRWDNQPWEGVGDTFRTVPPTGTGWHLFHVQARDGHGFLLDTLLWFAQDTTPPAAWLVSPEGTVLPGTLVVNGLSETLRVRMRDGASPVVSGWAWAQMIWDTNLTVLLGDSVQSLSIPWTEGFHTLRIQAGDSTGNVSTHLWTLLVFPQDSLPPRTHLLIQGPHAGQTPLVIRPGEPLILVAEDSGSGVREIQYAFPEPGDTVWHAYSSPVPAPTLPGSRPLVFSAVDSVGNREPVRETLLVTDHLPPAIFIRVDTPGWVVQDTLWLSSGSRVHLSSRDRLAGVRSLHAELDSVSSYFGDSTLSFPAPPHGIHELRVWTCDSLSWCDTLRRNVLVDTAAPYVHLQVVGPSLRHGDTIWTGPATHLVVQATDPPVQGVGTGPVIRYARWDHGPWIPVPETLTLPFLSGTHILHVFAMDRLHNRSRTDSVWLGVDRTPPIIRVVSPPDHAPINRAIALLGTWEDPFFSRLEVEVAPASSPVPTWTWLGSRTAPPRFTYDTLALWDARTSVPGWYTLRIRAEDSLGNRDTFLLRVGIPVLQPLIHVPLTTCSRITMIPPDSGCFVIETGAASREFYLLERLGTRKYRVMRYLGTLRETLQIAFPPDSSSPYPMDLVRVPSGSLWVFVAKDQAYTAGRWALRTDAHLTGMHYFPVPFPYQSEVLPVQRNPLVLGMDTVQHVLLLDRVSGGARDTFPVDMGIFAQPGGVWYGSGGLRMYAEVSDTTGQHRSWIWYAGSITRQIPDTLPQPHRFRATQKGWWGIKDVQWIYAKAPTILTPGRIWYVDTLGQVLLEDSTVGGVDLRLLPGDTLIWVLTRNDSTWVPEARLYAVRVPVAQWLAGGRPRTSDLEHQIRAFPEKIWWSPGEQARIRYTLPFPMDVEIVLFDLEGTPLHRWTRRVFPPGGAISIPLQDARGRPIHGPVQVLLRFRHQGRVMDRKVWLGGR